MSGTSWRLAARVYLALLLATAAALLPGVAGAEGVPLAALAGTLLAASVYAAFRPRRLSLNVVLGLLLLLLAPLALAPLLEGAGPLATPLAVMLALPALLPFDEALKRYNRRRQDFAAAEAGRHATRTLFSLVMAGLAVMVLAPVTGRGVLLLSGAALLAYLGAVVARALIALPARPFTVETALKRVIAGTQGGMYVQLANRTPFTLCCLAVPAESWVRARPPQFVVKNGSGAWLELGFKPSLAGESRPELMLSVLDPHGLLQVNQRLAPLQLHVIPMARYAEWLARKYLDQAEAGVTAGPSLPSDKSLKRGADYMNSRAYQPGDPLKDIDWKHTAKLNQLIVNTYGQSGQQAAIIAANLETASAAGADRLAFNLITVALTLAREDIPAALAAYDRRGVVLNTGILDTLEVLRQALALVREISPAGVEDRHLEPADIARVKRNIRQLQGAESEPARRLMELLDFEHRAVEEQARTNPATLALSAAAARVPAPATIFLVSQLNHDAEAVLVAAEKLARRQFKVVTVENK